MTMTCCVHIWARHVKTSYAICEQQMSRSACTSAQSGQHLVVRCLYSIIFLISILAISRLDCFCSWAGQLVIPGRKPVQRVFSWYGSFGRHIFQIMYTYSGIRSWLFNLSVIASKHNTAIVIAFFFCFINIHTQIHEYLICSGEPPDVAFVIAHAASFLVLKSARPRISINTGNMLASITACNIGKYHNVKIKIQTPELKTWFTPLPYLV